MVPTIGATQAPPLRGARPRGVQTGGSSSDRTHALPAATRQEPPKGPPTGGRRARRGTLRTTGRNSAFGRNGELAPQDTGAPGVPLRVWERTARGPPVGMGSRRSDAATRCCREPRPAVGLSRGCGGGAWGRTAVTLVYRDCAGRPCTRERTTRAGRGGGSAEAAPSRGSRGTGTGALSISALTEGDPPRSAVCWDRVILRTGRLALRPRGRRVGAASPPP